MKKLLIALAAVLPLSALAGEKVDLCHILPANDVVENFLGTGNDLHFGQVRNVSVNAKGHLKHGDFGLFFGPPVSHGPINLFREAGVKLPAADCYVLLTPEGDQVAPLP